jgi:hypothetical protein
LHEHSDYRCLAIIIAISHLVIDALKLYFTSNRNKASLFFTDQLTHVNLLLGITLLVYPVIATITTSLINSLAMSGYYYYACKYYTEGVFYPVGRQY